MFMENPVGDIYSADIGKTIYDGQRTGKVVKVSSRYCAKCHGVHPCYVACWDNNKTTMPCTAHVSTQADGTLKILP